MSYLLQTSYFGFEEEDQASGPFTVKINFETNLVDICGRTAWTALPTDRKRNTTLEYSVTILVSAGFNLLKTKRNLLYIRDQSVPRCKHFPPRL